MAKNEIAKKRGLEMTANELADYLEKAFYADEDISKATTMLRQQQAEIEALKKELALQKLSDIGQEFEQGELKALVKSFFEDYLGYQEESDSGRVFNPIHIGCTRVMMTKPLVKLLKRMKKLSGAK